MKNNAPSNEGQELKRESPLLHDLKSAPTGFRVPTNYFEEFADKLEPKLSERTRVVELFRLKLAAIAASVLLMLSVGIWILTERPAESSAMYSTKLWESEEMYFATSDVLYEEYEFSLSEADDEATIDYLVSEDVTIELILEEFNP